MAKRFGLGVATVVLLLARVAFAAATAGTTFYWTGGDGVWSNPANWSANEDGTGTVTRYPGQDSAVDSDVAYFVKAASGTVTVDVEVEIFRLYVESAKTPLDFVGNGRITTSSEISSSASLRSALYRPMSFGIRYAGKYLDCRSNIRFTAQADIVCTGSFYLWSNAHVYFEEGMNFGTGIIDIERQSGDATLTILGGKVTASKILLARSNSHLEIFGGEINALLSVSKPEENEPMTGCSMVLGGGVVNVGSGSLAIPDTCGWTFTNGTLIVAKAITDRRMLGTQDAVLIQNHDSYTSVNVLTEAEPTYEVNTTLYLTNGVSSGFAVTNNATVTGTGKLYLSRLYVAGDAERIANFGKDLNFYFLNGLINNTYETLAFPDGAQFGSIGDWRFAWRSKAGKLHLGGHVAIDTTDAFDGVTPHGVSLSKVYTKKNFLLDVTGMGSVTCDVTSVSEPFAGISVGEQATLTLTTASRTQVKALDLAAGATLNLTKPTTLLAESSVQIAPSAQIRVTVPDGTTDNPIPFINIHANDGTDWSERISLVGDGAAEYSVGNVEGFTFLTTGAQPSYGQMGASNIWTGTVDGNWTTPGNWASGMVPPAITASASGDDGIRATAFFGGTRNTVVTFTHGQTEVGVQRLHFLNTCGPFILRGNKLRVFANGYRSVGGSPIVSQSALPVVIENDLRTSNALSTFCTVDSFIQYDGTVTVAGLFRPAGDVRVGGCLTARGLLLEKTVGSGRPTKVGVVAGGKVTITAQYTNLVQAAATLDVRAGGTLEFQNGNGAYFGSVVEQTGHVVDGLLDVQCPMGTLGATGFSGTGKVCIAEIASNPGAGWAGHVGEFQFGGGMTVQIGQWNTADSIQPTSAIRLHAVGDVTLVSTNRCWYGPAADVAPTTTSADRALLIDAGAMLTIATVAHPLVLADAIFGNGTLRFAEGCLIRPAAARADRGRWTELARVGAIDGLPQTPGFNFKVEANEDGSVSLWARPIHGSTIYLR